MTGETLPPSTNVRHRCRCACGYVVGTSGVARPAGASSGAGLMSAMSAAAAKKTTGLSSGLFEARFFSIFLVFWCFLSDFGVFRRSSLLVSTFFRVVKPASGFVLVFWAGSPAAVLPPAGHPRACARACAHVCVCVYPCVCVRVREGWLRLFGFGVASTTCTCYAQVTY